MTSIDNIIKRIKVNNEVLDKREAVRDVLQVITEMMMFESPKGATREYQFGKQRYELQVKLIERKENDKGRETKNCRLL